MSARIVIPASLRSAATASIPLRLDAEPARSTASNDRVECMYNPHLTRCFVHPVFFT
jgi:hypothetical protein